MRAEQDTSRVTTIRNRWRIASARVLLAALVIALSACSLATTTTPGKQPTGHMRLPLTLGTNLALYDAHDQVVNSPSTVRYLQRLAVPIVRMPFRPYLPDDYQLKALRAIQQIGAIPIVIVPGPDDPHAQTDDINSIYLTRQVFANSTVYVEFGNEADLAGFPVNRYLDAWNATIPKLKAIAPSYLYVGPVNFEANPSYIATFDAHANPRPDANSWHEYACHPTESNDACMAHIADWSAHILATRSAVQGAIGVNLPLLITEWNLDAEPDARYVDAPFMRAWTTSALKELAADRSLGLVAALQYCVTNDGLFSLMTPSSTLTPQGEVYVEALTTASALR